MSDKIREALEAALEAFTNCPACADRVAMLDAALREMDGAQQPVTGVRQEVAAFALLMERELRANDYKGGWSHMTSRQLWRRVQEEVIELQNAITEASPSKDKIASEAADVANMAMMVADVCGSLYAAPPAPDAEIARAIAEEREACAKVCENLTLDHPGRADLTADQCAAAIRARGTQ